MRTNSIPLFSRVTSSDTNSRSDYNRLSPGGSSRFRLFGWRRFWLGAGFFLFLLFLLGPRHTREKVFDLGQRLTPSIARPGGKSSETFQPSSPETDPDPSRTVHCDNPYSPDKPLVQYALMVDAGSTGSRIHIYKFHNCKPQPTYEYEVFRSKRPGLSSYASSPVSAAESLDELLNDAMKVVPPSLHKCTPVAVKATAGLRLLGAQESSDILAAVQNRLSSHYPFPLDKENSVVILDGKEEGVYAWITVNYLTHALTSKGNPVFSTHAVLDLGGASTQFVFKPLMKADTYSQLPEGDHKFVLEFAGYNYTLYQHSYLGYGLMEARKSVHRLVHFMSSFNKESHRAVEVEIANPCLSRGTTKTVTLDKKDFVMTGADIGSFEGCTRVIELVMAKDAICLVKPCSFNGIYQPSIMASFPKGNIMLLSYFYDRISPLLNSTDNNMPTFPIRQIADLAEVVCKGHDSWHIHFGHNKEAMEELRDRPEYCLDLTFMYTLLRLGYEFDDSRFVTIAKKIENTELGWALGAGIALVGAHIECVT